MTGATVLLTRGNVHFANGSSVYPACGSRAQVQGFSYRADGSFELDEDCRDRLCATCMKRVGMSTDTEGDPT